MLRWQCWKRLVCIIVLLLLVGGNVYQYKELTVTRKQLEKSPMPDRHQSLRKVFIVSQAKNIDNPYTILVGDSIIEGIWLPNLGGIPVLNAGIGGAGVIAIRDLLKELPPSPVEQIVVAIGINDAVKSNHNFSISQWSEDYTRLLLEAKRITPKVYVCPILPIESGKGLGTEYFDVQRIDTMNAAIFDLANKLDVRIINTRNPFLDWQSQGKVFTSDGVHLTPEGAELLRRTLTTNFRKAS